MKDCLLDTNIWSGWFRNESYIISEIQKIVSNSRLYLSAIVWGEVIYGAHVNPKFSFEEYSEFISGYKPYSFPIDKAVAQEYGKLKASLFESKSEKTLRLSDPRASQLESPIPSKLMGVDENDLWIVSEALAYNLILITADKRMLHLLEIAPKELEYKILKKT